LANHRRRSLAASLLVLSGLTAALVGPAATFAASPDATTATTACSETHWPVSVQGKPLTLKTGARAGDYLWHDSTGWHLRVTHPGSAKVTFTGRIVSSAPMTFKPARLEKGDTITLSADKKTLTYKFYNYGKIDGVDFKTACAQRLSIAAAINGHKLAPSRIWLGRHGRHPLENRFVVVKIA
jgi:hypothetical protein